MFLLRALLPVGTLCPVCIGSNGHAGPGVPVLPALLLRNPLLRNKEQPGCFKRSRCKARDDPATEAGSRPPQGTPHSQGSQGEHSPHHSTWAFSAA